MTRVLTLTMIAGAAILWPHATETTPSPAPSDACMILTMVGPSAEDEIPFVDGFTIAEITFIGPDEADVTYCPVTV